MRHLPISYIVTLQQRLRRSRLTAVLAYLDMRVVREMAALHKNDLGVAYGAEMAQARARFIAAKEEYTQRRLSTESLLFHADML